MRTHRGVRAQHGPATSGGQTGHLNVSQAMGYKGQLGQGKRTLHCPNPTPAPTPIPSVEQNKHTKANASCHCDNSSNAEGNLGCR